MATFFQKLFIPISAARNIAIVWALGLLLLAVGAAIDWALYGSVHPDLLHPITAGDYLIIAAILVMALTLIFFAIKAIFSKPPEPVSLHATRSIAPIQERSSWQRLKTKWWNWMNKWSNPVTNSNIYLLSVICLLWGTIFQGSLDLSFPGILLAVLAAWLHVYRTLWRELPK